MVLLPCGKCCGKCVCSCECCTCSSGQVPVYNTNSASPNYGSLVDVQDLGDPTTEWRYYLTDPVPDGESVPFAALHATADLAAGLPWITQPSSVENIRIGTRVTGPGIPAGATVTQAVFTRFDGVVFVFLSANVTISATASPVVFYTDVTRRLLPAHYSATLAHLPDSNVPDCGVTRRWPTQAACVSSAIAAEKAAVISAGSPYTYDLFKGAWVNESLGKSVTIATTFGSGAAATVTKQSKNEITEITVTDGGSGYAKTIYANVEPTLTATGPGGTDAVLAVTLAPPTGTAPNQTWGVQSISVTSGGTGYTNGGAVTISAGAGVVVTAAQATVTTAREEPQHTIDTSGAGGTGAEFSFTYSYYDFGKAWELVGNGPFFTITKGGSGYSDGGTVLLVPGPGTVNFDGVPDPVSLSYETSSGAISKLYVDGGLWYRDRGVIESVTVQKGGAYHGKSDTATVETASVTAWVPGSNATLAATVDSDSKSGSFGKVTAINVTAANPDPPVGLLATATSFSLRDRGFLLQQITKNDPGNELITGPVSLANESAIDTYFATLFAGPLDLDQLHWGFCSEATDLAADDGWRLGWSTPYRSGEPLTPAAAAALCPAGSPRGHQVTDGNYVQTAWARPFFWPRGMGVANPYPPPIQRIVLTGSTGNATDDSVLSIIGDYFAAESLIASVRAAGGPDYDVPVLIDSGPERPIGSGLPGFFGGIPGTSQEAAAGRGGRWTVGYRLGKWNGARQNSKYEQWTLTVTFRPCSAAMDTSPPSSTVVDTFIHSYQLLYYSSDMDGAVVNSDVTHLIASSADLWAYGSEQKCLGTVPASPFFQSRSGQPALCSGTAYRRWFANLSQEGTVHYCHSVQPGVTD